MLKPIVILAAIALAAPSVAQDHSGHAAAPAIDLPAICLANATEPVPAMGHAMGDSPAHQDLMAGMDRMNAEMMAGGTASDIDVAFVCSMIPHHRGAIDMAQAELEHGDDPWARELATAVIAAQEREIAEMVRWLEGQE
ncbi:MAG: CopM family metallochaperone [Devosia sp.]